MEGTLLEESQENFQGGWRRVLPKGHLRRWKGDSRKGLDLRKEEHKGESETNGDSLEGLEEHSQEELCCGDPSSLIFSSSCS